MKKLLFLSTKPRVFWVELPPALLLIPSIIYNESVKSPMKLYPLIIILASLIVFFAIYFFRAISISYEEIRCVGMFSSKDKAMIKEGCSLVVTLLPRIRARVELFGRNDDGSLSYAWLKNEEPVKINLFRAKINGGFRQCEKILRYFECDVDDLKELCKTDSLKFESSKISVWTGNVNGAPTVKIYFNKTI